MNEPTREQLTALRDECYKIACDHGFHDEERSERHFLCLVITELSEAVQADRKDRHANVKGYYDSEDIYPYVLDFGTYIKDSVEDELADAAIRILDIAGMNGDTFEFDDKIADDLKYYFTHHTFTESVYEIIEFIVTIGYDYGLCGIFTLAEVMGFDLMEHIRLKMEYNRTRKRLHGVKY